MDVLTALNASEYGIETVSLNCFLDNSYIFRSHLSLQKDIGIGNAKIP